MAGIVVIVAVVVITFLVVSIAVVSVMRWRLSKMRVIVDLPSVRMNELEETLRDGKEVRLCVCVCVCVCVCMCVCACGRQKTAVLMFYMYNVRVPIRKLLFIFLH